LQNDQNTVLCSELPVVKSLQFNEIFYVNNIHSNMKRSVGHRHGKAYVALRYQLNYSSMWVGSGTLLTVLAAGDIPPHTGLQITWTGYICLKGRRTIRDCILTGDGRCFIRKSTEINKGREDIW